MRTHTENKTSSSRLSTPHVAATARGGPLHSQHPRAEKFLQVSHMFTGLLLFLDYQGEAGLEVELLSPERWGCRMPEPQMAAL